MKANKQGYALTQVHQEEDEINPTRKNNPVNGTIAGQIKIGQCKRAKFKKVRKISRMYRNRLKMVSQKNKLCENCQGDHDNSLQMTENRLAEGPAGENNQPGR